MNKIAVTLRASGARAWLADSKGPALAVGTSHFAGRRIFFDWLTCDD